MNQSLLKAWMAFAVVSLFLAFEMALQVSPSVMTGQLMSELHVNPAQLGWISGIYFASYTAMQIAVGLLFVRYPFKRVVISAISFCIVGALLFSFADNFFQALIARFITGIGSAFGFLSVLVVVARLFPTRYFAVLAGLTQCLAALGAVFGQSGIAGLVLSIGWRETLWGFAAFATVIAVLVFLLPCQESVSSETETISPWQGLKAVVSQPLTWWVALYAGLLWAPMTIFASLWGVPYLSTVYHLSPVVSASLTSLMFIGIAISSPVLGQWIKWFGSTEKVMRGCALLGFLISGLLLLRTTNQVWLLGAYILMMGATCAGQAMSFDLIKHIQETKYESIGLAFNNMGVVVAGFITQPLVGFLIHSRTEQGLSLELAYQHSFYVIPVCFISGYLVCKMVLNPRIQMKAQ